MADVHKILAKSTIATAPSPATTGLSLDVTAGEGARFDTGTQWVMVWPSGSTPTWGSGTATGGNFEIIRVTSRTTDTFTLNARAQEGTTARSIVVGDQIAQIIMPEDADHPVVENLLSADVSMASATTYYDGPSVSISAGTWLLVGGVTCSRAANKADFTAKLWDGTTVESSGGAESTAAAAEVHIHLSGIVTVTSTTTYKISAASSNSTNLMKAASAFNAAGNTASYLRAIRIAA